MRETDSDYWPVAAAIWFGLMPFVPLVGVYIVAPGFVMPFLNHAIVRWVFIGLLMVNLGTCGLLALSGVYRWSKVLRVLLTGLSAVTSLLFILAPMVGPAVFTILGSLGPVFGSK